MNVPHTPATTVGAVVHKPFASNVAAYGSDGSGGQAQVFVNCDLILHLSGDPADWRRLATVIEDAAMELERLLSDREAVAS